MYILIKNLHKQENRPVYCDLLNSDDPSLHIHSETYDQTFQGLYTQINCLNKNKLYV